MFGFLRRGPTEEQVSEMTKEQLLATPPKRFKSDTAERLFWKRRIRLAAVAFHDTLKKELQYDTSYAEAQDIIAKAEEAFNQIVPDDETYITVFPLKRSPTAIAVNDIDVTMMMNVPTAARIQNTWRLTREKKEKGS